MMTPLFVESAKTLVSLFNLCRLRSHANITGELTPDIRRILAPCPDSYLIVRPSFEGDRIFALELAERQKERFMIQHDLTDDEFDDAVNQTLFAIQYPKDRA